MHSRSFKFFWVFKGCFSKHGWNFVDVATLATLGLLKIKVFWNKSYEVMIPVCDVTNKILSHDSNYIADAVMWPKFGNSSISMRKVILTSIL